MKSFLLQLALVIMSISTVTGQEWNTVKDFSSGTIKSVLYVNESTAFAVSSLYNGTALNVKKTTDDGETWIEQFTGQTNQNFRKIISPNNGEDLFIIGNSGILMHSTNGEDNWDLVSIPTLSHLRDIFFLSPTIGYISCDNATILKTIDGGMTWINMNVDLSGIATIAKIHFISEDRGYIAGFNYFRETSNGGVTWTDVPGFENTPGTLYQIQDFFFVNDQVGYICGDQALLYKTTDGGNTWVDMKVDIPGIDFTIESLFSIHFLDNHPNIGFACGYHGLLIRTYDGGVNWELMSSDIEGTNTDFGSIFHDLDFFGNKGLMSSQHGQILKYVYSPTSIPELNQEKMSFQIFPNPATDNINIKISDVTIDQFKIYDYSGKIYKMIDYPKSNHIDCSDLESGNYILTISSNGIISAESFVKQ
ncbi:MAG: YCF48-related protein [Saprospiraceae bacterium]